jgi:hypothetical protein
MTMPLLLHPIALIAACQAIEPTRRRWLELRRAFRIAGRIAMAKGQQRSGREQKKPKKQKAGAATTAPTVSTKPAPNPSPVILKQKSPPA